MRTILKTFLGNRLVEVFLYPPFFFFIFSVVFSQIAFSIMNIALIFIIFSLTSSNLLVSLLILTFIVPQVLLSFIGGMIADLYHKKPILLYGNIFRALTILILFFFNKSPIMIFIMSFIISIISQFYVPAETPVIPKLVSKNNLTAANSIFSIALFGSILLGYVIAGPAITIFGRSNIFILLSLLFFVAAFSIFMIPEKLLFSNGVKNLTYIGGLRKFVKSELRSTYSLFNSIKGVGVAFLLLIMSQVLVLIVASIIPGYAKTVLEIDPEEMSTYIFAPAVIGMLLCSVMIGRLTDKINKEKLMTLGIFLSGSVFLIFPLMSKISSRSFILILNSILPGFLKINILHLTVILAFILGTANALIFISSQIIIQEKVPEIFRSKFYGLLFALTGVFSLIPIIVAGGIADIFGVNIVLSGIGIIILTLGFIFWGGSFIKFKSIFGAK